MRNSEIRERLEKLEENLQMLVNYLNNTLAITTRFCQCCNHDTVQKVLARYPATYQCMGCGNYWKPRIPDDQIGEEDIKKENIGFNINKETEAKNDAG